MFSFSVGVYAHLNNFLLFGATLSLANFLKLVNFITESLQIDMIINVIISYNNIINKNFNHFFVLRLKVHSTSTCKIYIKFIVLLISLFSIYIVK